MKAPGLFTVALVCLYTAVAYSQMDAGNISFDTITPKEAQEVINSIEGQQSRRDFAMGALKSKRSDLVEVCFRNEYTMGWIRNGVRDLPVSRFRDEMVVLMLKSDSPFWPPDGFVPQGSRAIGSMIVEPFASVAKAHLPNRTFDENLLKSRQARTNLAREIEQAMKAADNSPPLLTPKPVTPARDMNRPVTPSATTTPRELLKTIPETPARIPSAAPFGLGPGHAVFVGVIVLLVIGCLWTVAKAKFK